MSSNDWAAAVDAEIEREGGAAAVLDRRPAAPRKRRLQRTAAIDDSGAVAFSEDALALAFVRIHSGRLKWSPGMGWMSDRGTHWERDEKLERFDMARVLCRHAAVDADDEKEGKRLSSAKTVSAVLTLAQSDRSIVLPVKAWDADPFALNTGAKVIDLRTGQARPRLAADGQPLPRFFTQTTRVQPAAGDCPTWQQFLRAVFLDDLEVLEFVHRLLGYLLSADRSEQKLFFFYGLGANGKSTLVDLVAWILGSYAHKLPASVLMQSPVERHPTELAQLQGKRLAISSELDEGQFWAESRLKELTGDDVLTVRYMRGDFFEIAMTQTHVIVGNYKPRLRGGDAALARRFVMVPFLARFEGTARDMSMSAKLRAEAPQILAWMIEGAVKWRASGLRIPSSIVAASREYLSDNDDLSLWLDECCQLLPESRTPALELYESFSSWIKSRGQHAPSMRLFADRLSVLPGIAKVRSNGIRYTGIRLTLAEAERLRADQRGGFR